MYCVNKSSALRNSDGFLWLPVDRTSSVHGQFWVFIRQIKDLTDSSHLFPRMPSSSAAWILLLFVSSSCPASRRVQCACSRAAAPSRPAPHRSSVSAPFWATPPSPWTAPAWPPSRKTPAWTPTWERRSWRRRSGVRPAPGWLGAPSRTSRTKAPWAGARSRSCSDFRDSIRSTARRPSADPETTLFPDPHTWPVLVPWLHVVQFHVTLRLVRAGLVYSVCQTLIF